MRGIDDKGHTANYVETEQIMSTGNLVFSYVQARGSVPLFWEQVGLSASVNVTRSYEINEEAFKRHLSNVSVGYHRVLLVNLLSKKKPNEVKLANAWRELTAHSEQPAFFYVHFDFAQSSIGKLVAELTGLEEFPGFYAASEDFCTQTMLPRVSCLDCLENTNIAQSHIAWASLYQQMQNIRYYSFPQSLKDANEFRFTHHFLNLWTENGDALSLQYTGTRSIGLGGASKSRRQKLKDYVSKGFRSIERLYNANINDLTRQSSIDSLLRKVCNKRLIDDSEISLYEEKYSKFHLVKMRVVTWNLGGHELSQTTDLSQLLIGDAPPDILVVSLQEIVKLNPLIVIQPSINIGPLERLKIAISSTLVRTGQDYFCLFEEGLVGCALFTFINKGTIPIQKVTQVDTDRVKVGFKGSVGNKGGVLGRFCLYNTSVCICNCHLASGMKSNESRRQQLETIFSKGFQQPKIGKQAKYNVRNHDLKFVCGDLNFRILNDYETVVKLAVNGNYEKLLDEDQLRLCIKHQPLKGYKEGPITFPPTYKYNANTNEYDTSKKQRIPAWCDRILYNGKDISVEKYCSVFHYKESDHKPVYATLNFMVKEVDAVAKQKYKEYLQRQQSELSSQGEQDS